MKVVIALIWNSFVAGIVGVIPLSLIMVTIKIFSFDLNNNYLHYLNKWIFYTYPELSSSFKSIILHLLVAFFLVSIVSLIFATEFGTLIMKFHLSLRRPSKKEIDKLEPALRNIISQVELHYAKKIKYKLYVTDEHPMNIAIIGINTIVITKGAIINSTKQELQAMLAHEFGHIFYGDTTRSALALGADVCGSCSIRAYELVLKFLISMCEYCINIPLVGLAFNTIILVLSVFLVPILIFDRIQLCIFNWITRQEEYRADHFATKLGFGDGLLAILSREAQHEIQQSGFWKKYSSTHPSIELRVDKIISSSTKNVFSNIS
jgi:Zn-dependent protease with chaperone function